MAARRQPRCELEWNGEPGAAGELDRLLAQRAVDAALARDRLKGRSLSVLVVGDAACRRLHREHFRKATVTDVMSFPDGSLDPETGLIRLGDVAVCLDEARRVARRSGRTVAGELALYVLHGCLHLLGYDDVDPGDREEMWGVQRAIMAELGIAI